MPPQDQTQDEKYELNPEAAKQYNHVGPHAVWETRSPAATYDIRTITVAQIKQLVKDGCPYFEPKDKKPVDPVK